MRSATRSPRGGGDGPPVRLPVKVVPRASRDGIAGWLGDALKVHVSAPPERGRANAAVEATVAAALGVPKESVQIVAGRATPRKVIEISGLSGAEVSKRLGASRGT